MKQNIIIDTGPLVALINNREQYHSWATKEVANLAYPFFTCEAVISIVLTLDSDFRVYRKNKNEMVDLIIANGI